MTNKDDCHKKCIMTNDCENFEYRNSHQTNADGSIPEPLCVLLRENCPFVSSDHGEINTIYPLPPGHEPVPGGYHGAPTGHCQANADEYISDC